MINNLWFPNITWGAYWSASPSGGDAYGAWGVNFYVGYVNGYVRNLALPVRLVRASQ